MMTDDERKLLLTVARWIARKEQEEVDRMDMNTIFINELRRQISAVDTAGKPEPRRPEAHLLLPTRR